MKVLAHESQNVRGHLTGGVAWGWRSIIGTGCDSLLALFSFSDGLFLRLQNNGNRPKTQLLPNSCAMAEREREREREKDILSLGLTSRN
jgi:hypothetical protein